LKVGKGVTFVRTTIYGSLHMKQTNRSHLSTSGDN
jgi:hypothetical protein